VAHLLLSVVVPNFSFPLLLGTFGHLGRKKEGGRNCLIYKIQILTWA
jgi:hypothetical protein